MVPIRFGNSGLSVTAGVVVIGWMLPLASRVWKMTLTFQFGGFDQFVGFGSLMSTRQTLPCRSPAYTVFAGSDTAPDVFTAMTLDRPFASAALQTPATAAHRSIFASIVPCCG